MVVIADTSPLNYLVLIEQADVLPILFGKIVIPPSVLAELRHARAPQAVVEWIASAPPWLVVERNIPSLPGPMTDLDLGEREALALALAHQPDALLLIDEEKGREEAERRKVQTTGTLGFSMRPRQGAFWICLRPSHGFKPLTSSQARCCCDDYWIETQSEGRQEMNPERRMIYCAGRSPGIS